MLEKTTHNVFLVPLEGHSRGHCGVAVKIKDGWLFHCGDAYVRDMQIDSEKPRDPFPVLIRPITRQLFPAKTIKRFENYVENAATKLLCLVHTILLSILSYEIYQ